ncbi:MAG: hypothetical protein E2O38_14085 [Proteobacteria bacterium]|nr:MAG: hypothetical protein E2O38_14085 [Pseudomonadota bacterium]
MRRAISVITLSALIVVCAPTLADTLTGKVVKITDGDTLYVLDANYKEHKIRLAGIDAPERKQAYGLGFRWSDARARWRLPRRLCPLEPTAR